MVGDLGRAERMSNGSPVVILDQMRAIFAPSPNLPRVCDQPASHTDKSGEGQVSWAHMLSHRLAQAC
jgi:hypothetical protein